MSEKNTKLMELWDKVAPTFGEKGPEYWKTFGERLVVFSNIHPGAKVLDIGMGRGSSLFPALKRVGKEGAVIGIDFSEGMVKEVQRELQERNIENAEVKRMNAADLDFQEDSFDYIICGFGLGYLLLEDPKLRKVKNIIKKGGQVAFSVWGVQEDQNWLNKIIQSYLAPPAPPNATKETSPLPKFDTVASVSKLLKETGFTKLQVQEETPVVIYKNKEQWWAEMWSNAARGVLEQVQALGKAQWEACQRDIEEGLEAFRKEDQFHFTMPVIYALGEK